DAGDRDAGWAWGRGARCHGPRTRRAAADQAAGTTDVDRAGARRDRRRAVADGGQPPPGAVTRRGFATVGRALAALVAALALAPGASAATPDQVGAWGGVMDLGLPAAHEVVMHTGKVLFWTDAQARAWDPATGQVSPA